MRVSSPVGAPYKRQNEPVQVGEWYRTNWIGAYYLLGSNQVPTYHTGDDVVIKGASCAFKPVYAITDGLVTYAADVPHTTWGNLIVIKGNETLYTRYAHLDRMLVKAEDWVLSGQQIGTVGNAHGLLPYHLHVDVSVTHLLGITPRNWPGLDLATIRANYVDVKDWMEQQMAVENPDTAAAMRAALAALPQGTPVTITPALPPEREPFGTQLSYVVAVQDIVPQTTPPRATLTKYVTASPAMNVRQTAATSLAPVGTLAYQTAVTVYADQPDPAWWQIAVTNAQFPGDYLSAQWLSDTRPQ